MNRNNFFHIIKNIMDDYENFKENIENKNIRKAISYFSDDKNEEYDSNTFLSNIVCFELELLKKNGASKVYETYIELITYLTYLQKNIDDVFLSSKIQLTVSIVENDFMSLTEKLIRIEALRLISVISRYENSFDKIPILCKNFSLELHDYSYLLGYDKCRNDYEQISFIKSKCTLEQLDSISGNRRINYRKKLTTLVSSSFFENSLWKDYLSLIQNYIDDNAFLFLKDEINLLLLKKRKYSTSKSDEYQYYFTIK